MRPAFERWKTAGRCQCEILPVTRRVVVVLAVHSKHHSFLDKISANDDREAAAIVIERERRAESVHTIRQGKGM